MTNLFETEAKGILNPQSRRTLTRGPFPFTHSLSAYTGCQIEAATCGLFCHTSAELELGVDEQWPVLQPAVRVGGAEPPAAMAGHDSGNG